MNFLCRKADAADVTSDRFIRRSALGWAEAKGGDLHIHRFSRYLKC